MSKYVIQQYVEGNKTAARVIATGFGMSFPDVLKKLDKWTSFNNSDTFHVQAYKAMHLAFRCVLCGTPLTWGELGYNDLGSGKFLLACYRDRDAVVEPVHVESDPDLGPSLEEERELDREKERFERLNA